MQTIRLNNRIIGILHFKRCLLEVDKSVGRVGVRILNRGKQEYDVNIGPKIKSILGWYMVYDEIFIVFPDLDYQTRLPYK